jgi:hypothetical protein
MVEIGRRIQMAHERGPCKDSCLQDKRNCYHQTTCTIVRQFFNGRWLIENQYKYVKAVDLDRMVFEEGEYQIYHNPNAAPQYPSSSNPFSSTKIEERKETEEDFNAKLIRLKKMADSTYSTINTHINVRDLNGSTSDIDHWSDTDKTWHTKDCKIILR